MNELCFRILAMGSTANSKEEMLRALEEALVATYASDRGEGEHAGDWRSRVLNRLATRLDCARPTAMPQGLYVVSLVEGMPRACFIERAEGGQPPPGAPRVMTAHDLASLRKGLADVMPMGFIVPRLSGDLHTVIEYWVPA